MSSEEFESAKESIQLYPLEKNWMMLATWDVPHPFGESWNTPGGDYFEVNSMPILTDEELDASLVEYDSEENSIFFDITEWLINDVRSLDRNYGWILVTDMNIDIHGDRSSQNSPELRWREL